MVIHLTHLGISSSRYWRCSSTRSVVCEGSRRNVVGIKIINICRLLEGIYFQTTNLALFQLVLGSLTVCDGLSWWYIPYLATKIG